MVNGIDLFFALFNNLAIFIALIAIYSNLIVRFRHSIWFRRQLVVGLAFGLFAIGCMYARIPVFEGVIVDQRNAIVALSGAFGGPMAALLSAALAGAFRAYLGGGGVLGGVVGVSLAALAGVVLNRLKGRFDTIGRAAASALFATIVILPGFLFIGDLATGWALLKSVALPYGSAIFLGIMLVGLLLHREEERNRVELSFLENERKYREMVEGTEDLITQTDADGRFTFVNRVAGTLLGVKPKKCIGLPAAQFVHPDDQETTQEWFKKCVADKVPQAQMENRQVNAISGEARNVLWSSAFRYGNSGQLIGVGGIGRDITQMRRAEKNYKNLFEKMPNSYAVHEIIRDDQGNPVDYRFVTVNPAYAEMTGLKATDLIGRTGREVFPSTEEYWIDTYARIVFRGDHSAFENYFAELDKHFEVTTYQPAENQIACIFEDITFRKKAEEEKASLDAQLRYSQKMEAIGRLSGGIAHDFNNLLTVINGYSEMALSGLESESALYDEIQAISEAGGRAANLTSQLLAFSRKQVFRSEIVEMNAVIMDLDRLLRRIIGEDISINTVFGKDLGRIKADKTQLEQVFVNLVVNARDAVYAVDNPGHQKRITLETGNALLDSNYVAKHPGSSEGAHIFVSVSDNGVGMDSETTQKVFEPFFTTKDKSSGTGLGLATVYGIVKQNNASIYVYSEPGQGTVFKIYWPVTTEMAVDAPTEPEEVRDLAGNETILLVEDDDEVCRFAYESLSSYGYAVTRSANGREALDIINASESGFDLIATDLIMPELNGRDFAQRAQVLLPDAAVIYMSGYTDNHIVHDGLLDTGIHFIHKPYTAKSLVEMVRKVLDSR
jgi:PAS domain S-box-containing protein